MSRFFLNSDAWDVTPSLVGDEARHCARVMRAKVGDQIEVFDGRGRRATAVIESLASRKVGLRLGPRIESHPPATQIVLVPTVLKGKAMDWLIQKAVEIGVRAIEPVLTEHAVVKPGEGKEEKWQRIALEACKQCHQNWMPEITAPRPLTEWLDEAADGLRVIASLAEGSRPLRELLRECGQLDKVSYLVGPEGDFTEVETEACLAAGCRPVSLGPQVLRAETAGIYGVAALNYEFLRDFV